MVRQLFEEINRREVTIKEIAYQAGVPRGTVRGWRNFSPRLALFERMLDVLGLELRLCRKEVSNDTDRN